MNGTCPRWSLRVAVLALVAAATALLPAPGLPVWLLAAAAGGVTVAAVDMLGAFPVLAVELAAWIGAYGTGGQAPLVRCTAFAVALYLTWSAAALLAATGPVRRVPVRLVARWCVRCLPGLCAAVVVAVIVAVTGRVSGSVALEVVGLCAALVVGAVLVRAVRHGS